MKIELRNLRCRYGNFTAVDDVSLEVHDGELLALLGPSGSGKTTLLRIIAGLERPDSGQLLFDGVDVARAPVGQRNVGFVFQHYALFPHLSVFENVAFGLRVRSAPDHEVRARVAELLRLVRLEELALRKPGQLSGGQRQRIALARALAPRPRVLLLDEPFGALDAQVRGELREWLRRLHDEIGVTSIFVTHDQSEALEIADRVAITHRGRLEQLASPREVYDEPATPFVVEFLGRVNRLEGSAQLGRAAFGDLVVDWPEQPGPEPRPVVGYLRHDELTLSRQRAPGAFAATILRVSDVGGLAKLELRTRAGTLRAELPAERARELALRRDEELFVLPRRVRLFSERRAVAASPVVESRVRLVESA